MIKHMAFIMDGNRRYASKNKISLREGYKKGMEKFLEFVSFQLKYKIPETTFFALSTGNYTKRPESEKKVLFDLMDLFSENQDIEEFFVQNNILISLKGDLASAKRLENKAKGKHKNLIDKLTKRFEEFNKQIKNVKFKVNIALNYDGQRELAQAMKAIGKKIEKGEMKASSITEKTIKKHIYFNDSVAPEVIVRPGNVPRISGFMLWDSAYSEMYLTKKLWPEMDRLDFENIISWYSSIKRNFGK